MAQRAFTLGLAVLLEIREEGDCEKAYDIMNLAEGMDCTEQLVLGINARDLATFRIDPLVPVRVRCRMNACCAGKGASLRLPPFIAESGITTEAAARFAGLLKFRGVLIGEAAARSPGRAHELVAAFTGAAERYSSAVRLWEKIAVRLEQTAGRRPLVKICGITNADDAHGSRRGRGYARVCVQQRKSPVCRNGQGAQHMRVVRQRPPASVHRRCDRPGI